MLGAARRRGRGAAVLAAAAILLVRVAGAAAPEPRLDVLDARLLRRGAGAWSPRPDQIAHLRTKATSGDPDAAYTLGLAYLYGDGVSSCTTEAATWLRQAAGAGNSFAQVALGAVLSAAPLRGADADADAAAARLRDWTAAKAWLRGPAANGDAAAQLLLGRLLLAEDEAAPEGRSVSGDGEALRLLRSAADSGLREAHHLLGVAFEYGAGVARDFSAARRHYAHASEQSYPPSTYHLALMRAYGRGEAQSVHDAVRLFQQCADQAFAPCQFMLGALLVNGQGPVTDYTLGRRWIAQAASASDPSVSPQASRALEELDGLLAQADAWQQAHRVAPQVRAPTYFVSE